MSDANIGSSFDDFLEGEGIRAEVEAAAIKAIIADMMQDAIAAGTTKTALAEKMNTSRTMVDRLLDPGDTSITLATLINASMAVDRRLVVSIEDPAA